MNAVDRVFFLSLGTRISDYLKDVEDAYRVKFAEPRIEFRSDLDRQGQTLVITVYAEPR